MKGMTDFAMRLSVLKTMSETSHKGTDPIFIETIFEEIASLPNYHPLISGIKFFSGLNLSGEYNPNNYRGEKDNSVKFTEEVSDVLKTNGIVIEIENEDKTKDYLIEVNQKNVTLSSIIKDSYSGSGADHIAEVVNLIKDFDKSENLASWYESFHEGFSSYLFHWCRQLQENKNMFLNNLEDVFYERLEFFFKDKNSKKDIFIGLKSNNYGLLALANKSINKFIDENASGEKRIEHFLENWTNSTTNPFVGHSHSGFDTLDYKDSESRAGLADSDKEERTWKWTQPKYETKNENQEEVPDVSFLNLLTHFWSDFLEFGKDPEKIRDYNSKSQSNAESGSITELFYQTNLLYNFDKENNTINDWNHRASELLSEIDSYDKEFALGKGTLLFNATEYMNSAPGSEFALRYETDSSYKILNTAIYSISNIFESFMIINDEDPKLTTQENKNLLSRGMFSFLRNLSQYLSNALYEIELIKMVQEFLHSKVENNTYQLFTKGISLVMSQSNYGNYKSVPSNRPEKFAKLNSLATALGERHNLSSKFTGFVLAVQGFIAGFNNEVLSDKFYDLVFENVFLLEHWFLQSLAIDDIFNMEEDGDERESNKENFLVATNNFNKNSLELASSSDPKSPLRQSSDFSFNRHVNFDESYKDLLDNFSLKVLDEVLATEIKIKIEEKTEELSKTQFDEIEQIRLNAQLSFWSPKVNWLGPFIPLDDLTNSKKVSLDKYLEYGETSSPFPISIPSGGGQGVVSNSVIASLSFAPNTDSLKLVGSIPENGMQQLIWNLAKFLTGDSNIDDLLKMINTIDPNDEIRYQEMRFSLPEFQVAAKGDHPEPSPFKYTRGFFKTGNLDLAALPEEISKTLISKKLLSNGLVEHGWSQIRIATHIVNSFVGLSTEQGVEARNFLYSMANTDNGDSDFVKEVFGFIAQSQLIGFIPQTIEGFDSFVTPFPFLYIYHLAHENVPRPSDDLKSRAMGDKTIQELKVEWLKDVKPLTSSDLNGYKKKPRVIGLKDSEKIEYKTFFDEVIGPLCYLIHDPEVRKEWIVFLKRNTWLLGQWFGYNRIMKDELSNNSLLSGVIPEADIAEFGKEVMGIKLIDSYMNYITAYFEESIEFGRKIGIQDYSQFVYKYSWRAKYTSKNNSKPKFSEFKSHPILNKGMSRIEGRDKYIKILHDNFYGSEDSEERKKLSSIDASRFVFSFEKGKNEKMVNERARENTKKKDEEDKKNKGNQEEQERKKEPKRQNQSEGGKKDDGREKENKKEEGGNSQMDPRISKFEREAKDLFINEEVGNLWSNLETNEKINAISIVENGNGAALLLSDGSKDVWKRSSQRPFSKGHDNPDIKNYIKTVNSEMNKVNKDLFKSLSGSVPDFLFDVVLPIANRFGAYANNIIAGFLTNPEFVFVSLLVYKNMNIEIPLNSDIHITAAVQGAQKITDKILNFKYNGSLFNKNLVSQETINKELGSLIGNITNSLEYQAMLVPEIRHHAHYFGLGTKPAQVENDKAQLNNSFDPIFKNLLGDKKNPTLSVKSKLKFFGTVYEQSKMYKRQDITVKPDSLNVIFSGQTKVVNGLSVAKSFSRRVLIGLEEIMTGYYRRDESGVSNEVYATMSDVTVSNKIATTVNEFNDGFNKIQNLILSDSAANVDKFIKNEMFPKFIKLQEIASNWNVENIQIKLRGKNNAKAPIIMAGVFEKFSLVLQCVVHLEELWDLDAGEFLMSPFFHLYPKTFELVVKNEKEEHEIKPEVENTLNALKLNGDEKFKSREFEVNYENFVSNDIRKMIEKLPEFGVALNKAISVMDEKEVPGWKKAFAEMIVSPTFEKWVENRNKATLLFWDKIYDIKTYVDTDFNHGSKSFYMPASSGVFNCDLGRQKEPHGDNYEHFCQLGERDWIRTKITHPVADQIKKVRSGMTHDQKLAIVSVPTKQDDYISNRGEIKVLTTDQVIPYSSKSESMVNVFTIPKLRLSTMAPKIFGKEFNEFNIYHFLDGILNEAKIGLHNFFIEHDAYSNDPATIDLAIKKFGLNTLLVLLFYDGPEDSFTSEDKTKLSNLFWRNSQRNDYLKGSSSTGMALANGVSRNLKTRLGNDPSEYFTTDGDTQNVLSALELIYNPPFSIPISPYNGDYEIVKSEIIKQLTLQSILALMVSDAKKHKFEEVIINPTIGLLKLMDLSGIHFGDSNSEETQLKTQSVFKILESNSKVDEDQSRFAKSVAKFIYLASNSKSLDGVDPVKKLGELFKKINGHPEKGKIQSVFQFFEKSDNFDLKKAPSEVLKHTMKVQNEVVKTFWDLSKLKPEIRGSNEVLNNVNWSVDRIEKTQELFGDAVETVKRKNLKVYPPPSVDNGAGSGSSSNNQETESETFKRPIKYKFLITPIKFSELEISSENTIDDYQKNWKSLIATQYFSIDDFLKKTRDFLNESISKNQKTVPDFLKGTAQREAYTILYNILNFLYTEYPEEKKTGIETWYQGIMSRIPDLIKVVLAVENSDKIYNYAMGDIPDFNEYSALVTLRDLFSVSNSKDIATENSGIFNSVYENIGAIVETFKGYFVPQEIFDYSNNYGGYEEGEEESKMFPGVEDVSFKIRQRIDVKLQGEGKFKVIVKLLTASYERRMSDQEVIKLQNQQLIENQLNPEAAIKAIFASSKKGRDWTWAPQKKQAREIEKTKKAKTKNGALLFEFSGAKKGIPESSYTAEQRNLFVRGETIKRFFGPMVLPPSQFNSVETGLSSGRGLKIAKCLGSEPEMANAIRNRENDMEYFEKLNNITKTASEINAENIMRFKGDDIFNATANTERLEFVQSYSPWKNYDGFTNFNSPHLGLLGRYFSDGVPYKGTKGMDSYSPPPGGARGNDNDVFIPNNPADSFANSLCFSLATVSSLGLLYQAYKEGNIRSSQLANAFPSWNPINWNKGTITKATFATGVLSIGVATGGALITSFGINYLSYLLGAGSVGGGSDLISGFNGLGNLIEDTKNRLLRINSGLIQAEGSESKTLQSLVQWAEYLNVSIGKINPNEWFVRINDLTRSVSQYTDAAGHQVNVTSQTENTQVSIMQFLQSAKQAYLYSDNRRKKILENFEFEICKIGPNGEVINSPLFFFSEQEKNGNRITADKLDKIIDFKRLGLRDSKQSGFYSSGYQSIANGIAILKLLENLVNLNKIEVSKLPDFKFCQIPKLVIPLLFDKIESKMSAFKNAQRKLEEEIRLENEYEMRLEEEGEEEEEEEKEEQKLRVKKGKKKEVEEVIEIQIPPHKPDDDIGNQPHSEDARKKIKHYLKKMKSLISREISVISEAYAEVQAENQAQKIAKYKDLVYKSIFSTTNNQTFKNLFYWTKMYGMIYGPFSHDLHKWFTEVVSLDWLPKSQRTLQTGDKFEKKFGLGLFYGKLVEDDDTFPTTYYYKDLVLNFGSTLVGSLLSKQIGEKLSYGQLNAVRSEWVSFMHLVNPAGLFRMGIREAQITNKIGDEYDQDYKRELIALTETHNPINFDSIYNATQSLNKTEVTPLVSALNTLKKVLDEMINISKPRKQIGDNGISFIQPFRVLLHPIIPIIDDDFETLYDKDLEGVKEGEVSSSGAIDNSFYNGALRAFVNAVTMFAYETPIVPSTEIEIGKISFTHSSQLISLMTNSAFSINPLNIKNDNENGIKIASDEQVYSTIHYTQTKPGLLFLQGVLALLIGFFGDSIDHLDLGTEKSDKYKLEEFINFDHKNLNGAAESQKFYRTFYLKKNGFSYMLENKFGMPIFKKMAELMEDYQVGDESSEVDEEETHMRELKVIKGTILKINQQFIECIDILCYLEKFTGNGNRFNILKTYLPSKLIREFGGGSRQVNLLELNHRFWVNIKDISEHTNVVFLAINSKKMINILFDGGLRDFNPFAPISSQSENQYDLEMDMQNELQLNSQKILATSKVMICLIETSVKLLFSCSRLNDLHVNPQTHKNGSKDKGKVKENENENEKEIELKIGTNFLNDIWHELKDNIPDRRDRFDFNDGLTGNEHLQRISHENTISVIICSHLLMRIPYLHYGIIRYKPELYYLYEALAPFQSYLEKKITSKNENGLYNFEEMAASIYLAKKGLSAEKNHHQISQNVLISAGCLDLLNNSNLWPVNFVKSCTFIRFISENNGFSGLENNESELAKLKDNLEKITIVVSKEVEFEVVY